jgi:rhomboid family GlyGly-CTERM serine protease
MRSGQAPHGSQGSGRLPWLTLLLSGLVVALYLLLGPAPPGLVFDHARVAQGEVWRLLSAHLVHSDAAHLAWNLAAFVILGVLLEWRAGCRGWAFLGLLVAAALAVDAWLWWLQPDLRIYCGLSGVLNALYAALAALLWLETRHPLFPLALLGDLAKIAVEAANGGALLPTTTWSAVPGAHLAGIVAGLIFVSLVAARDNFPRCAALEAGRGTERPRERRPARRGLKIRSHFSSRTICGWAAE